MEIEKSLFLGPQPWSILEWLSGQIFADICTSLSDVPDMSLANILFCTRKNKHLQAPTWENRRQGCSDVRSSEVSLGADDMTQILKLSTEKYDRKIFVTDYSSNKNISEGE